ncbi:hypothetical protein ABWW58_10260 [Sporolactobacillus sp. STCC-11]|uniref:hypothetical protein n=1 Tax=Sporolactobacillus caesalpiniae TaxID=3230362 RepID=UPI003393DC67
MFRAFFSFFLLIHTLGYFYFQWDRPHGNKTVGYASIMRQGFIYLLVSLLCLIPFWSTPLLISALILPVLYFLLSNVTFFMKQETNPKQFIRDQLIILGYITVASSLLVFMGAQMKLLFPLQVFFTKVALNPFKGLAWMGLLLLVMQPANVTIKKLVERYRPAPIGQDSDSNKAGALIGSLERIIILLLINAGQYSAIGLVLTAKSVARYNKIIEDKAFAEYYLIGSLLSTLYAISSYLIFM